MFDERGFIARFEASDAEELIHLLNHPSVEEEQALRAHLGDPLYQRMHGMALRCRIERDREVPRGNVVIIPGFFGSELALSGAEPRDARLWLNLPEIVHGSLKRLRLTEDGLEGFLPADDVEPRGLVKRQYGELMLSLSRHWEVRGFHYDWRKDIGQSVGNLLAHINSWFGVDAPVHIVAHGMGGLIARLFVRDQKTRWRSMRSRNGKPPSGGRLVMLGSASHGSFQALRALCGNADQIKALTAIDQTSELTDILKVVHSFASVYQSLPHPLIDERLEALFDARTYGELHISDKHLQRAREVQEHLAEAIDVQRMVQVLGYGYRTTTEIADFEKVTSEAGYLTSSRGDGNVAIDLARLRNPGGEFADIATYYLKADHSALPCSPRILAALDELLEGGRCTGLEQDLPTDLDQMEDSPANISNPYSPDGDVISRVKKTALRLHIRGGPSQVSRLTSDERVLSEGLMRGLSVPVAMISKRSKVGARFKIPEIELGVVCGRIGTIDYDKCRSTRDHHPVDAVAVGHYVGDKPHGQELELDETISRAHLAKLGVRKAQLEESDLLLTQYTERGIIRGELGQPFFLDDPRVKHDGKRLIVIAGMGLPGRFGVPELSVLVRELVWSVGRLGNKHLCVAQIGTKNANLTVGDALSGWVRGIKAAITGADETERRHLARISFVVSDPRKIRAYQEAILREQKQMDERRRLKILYERLPEERLRDLQEEGLRRQHDKSHARLERRQTAPTNAPTRVTLGVDREVLRYGAVTEEASIPERTVPIDPDLIEEANKELASESEPSMQLERGRFLERLIVPTELRHMMSSNAPLVMMLDSTAARIHWEMVATSDPVRAVDSSQANPPAAGDSFGTFEFESYFLGTSRGFTRQLRTTFAPPPEPPPPPQRILRVLIIADPAEDARLPGAEAEGVEIADLFESFNTVHASVSQNQVEVVRLLGPREATRTNVLRELLIRSYDVLHFAGHCVYDQKTPKESGWLFTGGEHLSARELTRIDRVPKFIFSNACESGITPDRSDRRSAALAPTFAEAFFERGVCNFVCTAWPVNDGAARLFALNLYARLLGLRRDECSRDHYDPDEPAAMVDAMRDARLAIASLDGDGGVSTWGAYQHYGNPYYRFFAPSKSRIEPVTTTKVGKAQANGANSAKPKSRKQPTKKR